MANNYTTVGFDISDPAGLEAMVTACVRAERAEALPSFVGGAYLRCHTPEGAELWGTFSPDRQLLGASPHFSGESRFRLLVTSVEAIGPTPLNGQIVAELIEDEQGVPLVVAVPDYWRYAARLPTPVEAIVQIAAFAQELSLFASEEELMKSPMKLAASGALIPSGTFIPGGGPRTPFEPLAIFAGRIEHVSRVFNAIGGLDFYVCRVKTLGGIIDVVADPEHVTTEPAPGHIVAGSFFVSGRLIEPLPATPVPLPAAERREGTTSWWRRLFGS